MAIELDSSFEDTEDDVYLVYWQGYTRYIPLSTVENQTEKSRRQNETWLY